MRPVAQADRGGRAGDLLHRDNVLGVAQTGAAVLLLDRDAVQAERAEARPQIARELVVRSIVSARGAISACAKPATVSRIMSAVSPRSKLSDGS